MIDEFTVGATLSGLVTVSHNVHIELAAVDTGVAYGAPGMPTGCPFGIRFSSSDFTALGVPALPSTSRAEVRLYTGCSRLVPPITTYNWLVVRSTSRLSPPRLPSGLKYANSAAPRQTTTAMTMPNDTARL